MTTCIEFTDTSKTFVSSFRRKQVHAVKNMNLAIHPGEIFGIIGPNGAGKSTVLKMLMGFIRPDSGTISILGGPPSDPKTRFDIGYLPESPYYYDHLSAEELMKFSAATSGLSRAETRERMDGLLKTMNLEHARKRKLRTYSKGMTQRAGICFALVHDPKLVILDEPMSGLDPLGRKLVVDLVLELKRQGKTVLFCSHILNDVERLCDRMAIMSGGEIKAILDRDEILSSQGEMLLTLNALPDSLRPVLDDHNVRIDEGENRSRLACPGRETVYVIRKISEHGGEIRNIRPVENKLEKIFLETIDRGTIK